MVSISFQVRVQCSEVVRKAIARLAAEQLRSDKSLASAWKHLVGSVSGGPADLSENTGKKFREMLQKKRR